MYFMTHKGPGGQWPQASVVQIELVTMWCMDLRRRIQELVRGTNHMSDSIPGGMLHLVANDLFGFCFLLMEREFLIRKNSSCFFSVLRLAP
jgi:hypothetical protein